MHSFSSLFLFLLNAQEFPTAAPVQFMTFSLEAQIQTGFLEDRNRSEMHKVSHPWLPSTGLYARW